MSAAPRSRTKAVPLDDDESARLIVDAARSRVRPDATIIGRLDSVWSDGLDWVVESQGDDVISRWLDRVQEASPDRHDALRDAVEVARTAPSEDGPSDDIRDRWPVIDPTAYYGIAGRIVAESGPHTEADPVAILIQFLAAYANAVGRGPHWVAGATRHYLVLFAVLVGATSAGRKGSSWDVVRYFISDLDGDWAKNRVTRGLSSGEGLIYHVRDKVTRIDPRLGEVVEDAGVSDKRLLAIESELGRTFKVMSRDSNTLSAVLRQVWDCDGRLATLTKNSATVATDPHIGVIGHITADELASLLNNVESANGFGNRFLWACVRRSKVLPDGGTFFDAHWGGLQRQLREVFSESRRVGRMGRDRQANDLWHDLYADLSEGKPGLLGAMLARAEAQVMRLACVYALLDGSGTVTEPHLRAALAVWGYCEASARYVFGDSLGDPQAERLISGLRMIPAGLKRSEISAAIFNGHLGKDKLAPLLEHLLSMGLIHRVTRQTAGRPAELWFAGRAK